LVQTNSALFTVIVIIVIVVFITAPVVAVIIIIIIIIFSFTHGIHHTRIPETNPVPREHTVAVILLLLFMVPHL
jgi:hypothetical protein